MNWLGTSLKPSAYGAVVVEDDTEFFICIHRSERQRWSTLFQIGLFVECVAVEGSCWSWLRQLRARRWTISQRWLVPRFVLRDFEFALTVSRKELTPRAKVVYFLVLVTACFRLVIQRGVADGKLEQVDGHVLVSLYRRISNGGSQRCLHLLLVLD